MVSFALETSAKRKTPVPHPRPNGKPLPPSYRDVPRCLLQGPRDVRLPAPPGRRGISCGRSRRIAISGPFVNLWARP